MLFSGQVGNGKSDAALGESRKGRTAGGVFGAPVPDVGHANVGGPSVNVKLIVAILAIENDYRLSRASPPGCLSMPSMSHLDRMKAFAPRSNASVGVMGSANPSDFALLLAAPAARSRRGTYSERSADKQRSFEAERLAAQQGLGGLVYERDLGGRSLRCSALGARTRQGATICDVRRPVILRAPAALPSRLFLLWGNCGVTPKRAANPYRVRPRASLGDANKVSLLRLYVRSVFRCF
jgi:hypothetical protein